jgi:hypothetical protein
VGNNMEIKFDGKQETILKILSSLPGVSKAIRTCGNSIIIPTQYGAKSVYNGDIVVIGGDLVIVKERKNNERVN